MQFLGLTGVSFLKLAVTGLVWISFIIAFHEYISYQHYLKRQFPFIAYIVLTLLLVWNVFNVFRSIVTKDGPLTTILGNVASSLAILVPFSIIFSFYIINLKVLHKYFFNVLKLAVIVFVAFLLIYGKDMTPPQMLSLIILFSPVSFLITSLPLQSKKTILFILTCVLCLMFSAYLFSSRTAMLRVILLFICLFGFLLYITFRIKWILLFSCLVLVLPFALLQQSYVTGESAFEKYLGNTNDDEYSVDTRTFLYTELFEDLSSSGSLITGKGANGSYYSEYFYSIDLGETHNRNNLEVGILGILLKGGFIAVFLNLFLLVIAIVYAFFRSNNIYTIGLGYILIVHFMLLFLENYTIYSSYNFFVWFFIGVCLSKKMRGMNNTQIRAILNQD